MKNWWTNRNLRVKLALSFIALTVLSVGVAALVYYQELKDALLQRTLEQLNSVNILKHQHMQRQLILNWETALGYEPYATQDEMVIPEMTIADLTVSQSNVVLRFGHVSRDSTVVYQEFMNNIGEFLLFRTGLGTTGESYLVGADTLMRTPSRFMPGVNQIKVATPGVHNGLAGKEGTGIFPDYRGVPVLSVYRPIELGGLQWVLLSEIDQAEALAPLDRIRWKLIAVTAILLVLVSAFAVAMANRRAQSVLLIKDKLDEMGQGIQPSIPMAMLDRKDEIGMVFKQLQRLRHNVGQTIDFAARIGQGDFSADHQLLSQHDALGKSLITMRDQLKALNEKAAELEVKAKKSLIDGQEVERDRIAQELHDGLSPYITLIKLNLERIADPAQQEMTQLIDNAIDEIRRISYSLTPSVLKDFGPGQAVQNLLDIVTSSGHLTVQYVNDLKDDQPLSTELNLAIYRIVQECTNNVIKHAEASEIKVSLTQFDTQVIIFIQDNGKGFDQNAPKDPTSSGLRYLQERVRVLNGKIDLESRPGAGTRIEVELPIV